MDCSKCLEMLLLVWMSEDVKKISECTLRDSKCYQIQIAVFVKLSMTSALKIWQMIVESNLLTMEFKRCSVITLAYKLKNCNRLLFVSLSTCKWIKYLCTVPYLVMPIPKSRFVVLCFFYRIPKRWIQYLLHVKRLYFLLTHLFYPTSRHTHSDEMNSKKTYTDIELRE